MDLFFQFNNISSDLFWKWSPWVQRAPLYKNYESQPENNRVQILFYKETLNKQVNVQRDAYSESELTESDDRQRKLGSFGSSKTGHTLNSFSIQH